MARPPLLDLLRHHAWATIRLIEFAKGLTAEQRAWTVPGTYGSIDQTLSHIVGADGYYLFRLTGAWPPGGPMRPDGPVDLDDLMTRARAAAELYERYAAADLDPDEVRRHEGSTGLRTETVGTILAQVLHHGNEHRSHVGTILGAHGIEHPDYSGWAWGRRSPDTTER
jgi:uncharacterized damage-inducible protein DinB